MVKPKALIVAPSFQSFILQDLKTLSEKYDLTINHYDWKKKELAPIYLIRQFLHLLVNVPQSRFILIHFGGYWSFFPTLLGKVFGKPSYVILHGTDCASIPELNYGSLRIPLLKFFCKLSYEWATLLLPVSSSLVRHSNEFYRQSPPLSSGFAHHFPGLKTPYQIIPNGFEVDFWKVPSGNQRQEGTFLAVLSAEQYILKGVDLIVELARRFPENTFKIAGFDKPMRQQNLSPNLEFLGKLSPSGMRSAYQQSSFYFQLSVFEGFGCALCEAMLSGCIPIVSSVNELPHIVGNYGYILGKRNSNQLEKIIRKALSSPPSAEDRNAVRQRIKSLFPFEYRKKRLLEVLPK